MMCVCVITLIGWKMDGWIGLSGCGKWMKSGCGLSGCGCGKWRGSGSHNRQAYVMRIAYAFACCLILFCIFIAYFFLLM